MTIETVVAKVWMEDDGIIRMHFKPTTQHGLQEAIDVVEAHNRLAEEVPRGVIADIRDVTTGADRSAREYYVSHESSRLKTGMAMLVSSPLQRMLGNIFFRINRPPYPSRMFADEQDAIHWLNTLSVDG